MTSNPINAKSLMAFFEKEYGVNWIEHTTERGALDIITERKQQSFQKHVCGTCRFMIYGDGEYTSVEDMICSSAHSPQAREFVKYDSYCDHWAFEDDVV